MPANLTPQYREAEERYRKAITNEEKHAALKEMIALLPKHKHTEKMFADLKKKLSVLEREMKSKPKSVSSRREKMFNIPKQGAGQIALLGAPNTGKSSLFVALTGADSVIAEWPYSTQQPVVGMIPFENIQFQLVDMPPMIDENTEPWQWGILRNADLVLALFEASSAQDQIPRIKLELERYSLDKILWVAAKMDLLANGIMPTYEVDSLFVSADQLIGLDELTRAIFTNLNIIRVYTKQPGKEADFSDPVILKRGSVLIDAAVHLHKDFAENLTFARLWNKANEGIRVARDYLLVDGDVVEFHTR